MNLSMSTEEIKSRYKEMKPTQDRLQILADLNVCEKKTIQAVLDGNEPEPVATQEGRKRYTAWTKDEEESLIKMVKTGFTPKEASQKLGRSSQGTIQKADKLGYPFKVRRGPKGKCESGVCAVSKETGNPSIKAELQTPVNVPGLIALPKVGELVPAVGKLLIGNPEPAKPDYAETVRTITDQLTQIIQYADKLRQENDRLTQQLARVREAVE